MPVNQHHGRGEYFEGRRATAVTGLLALLFGFLAPYKANNDMKNEASENIKHVGPGPKSWVLQ